ncbi:MAG TPA: caspase family protein [bacterium]|nr:caspase family protein [bacterium]HQI47060.1 caspase family protein [bacterium]HQJ65383.1 caspase family protein [bacterium]
MKSLKALSSVLILSFSCHLTAMHPGREDTRNSNQITERIPVEKSAANIALLIGINSYPNMPQNRQLKGCINDVLLMKKLLIEQFGFKEDNIKTLLNSEATRENIETSFNNFLIAQASPKKQVLFYYSGHGAKMTDLNNDEMDGYDEAIVPYDGGNQRDQALYIVDEILGAWIEVLTKKCKNVTVILDCCHSGSGTRGGFDLFDARARFADTLKLDLPHARGSRTEIPKGPSGFLPPNPNYVLISGSADNELSWEIGSNGALTKALYEALSTPESKTYREVMYQVAAKVLLKLPDQHPQIEGGRRDAQVFGELGKVDQYLTINKRSLNRIQLSGGSAHRVTPGSVYAIFKPGTKNKADSSRYLGDVTVSSDVEAFTAWADPRDPGIDLPLHASAFERFHHYGDMQLPILLELKQDPAFFGEVKRALEEYRKQEDLVKIVSGNEDYAVKLTLSPDRKILLLKGQDQRDIKAFARDTLDLAMHLLPQLTKIARWRNLFDLENRADLKVSLSLHRWASYDSQQKRPVGPMPIEETAGGTMVFHDQDIFTVTFKNNGDREVYCYLLDLGSSGKITYLFPGRGAKDRPLAPGDSVSSYAMQISLPEGLNAIKLIATNNPADFSVLEQEGYRAVGRGQAAPSGIESPLGRLLNLAYGGTRDTSVIDASPIDEWTTAMAAFVIKPKASN